MVAAGRRCVSQRPEIFNAVLETCQGVASRNNYAKLFPVYITHDPMQRWCSNGLPDDPRLLPRRIDTWESHFATDVLILHL
jgi:hypothetical protein